MAYQDHRGRWQPGRKPGLVAKPEPGYGNKPEAGDSWHPTWEDAAKEAYGRSGSVCSSSAKDSWNDVWDRVKNEADSRSSCDKVYFQINWLTDYPPQAGCHHSFNLIVSDKPITTVVACGDSPIRPDQGDDWGFFPSPVRAPNCGYFNFTLSGGR